MSKYKFYGNKLTIGPRHEEHPSIDLGIKNGKWENIAITGSPLSNDTYTEFDVNPNPNWREVNEKGEPIKRCFFRRYVRKDPLYAKLSEYPYYSLVKSDEDKIDSFLKERQMNIEIDKARRETAKKRKNDAKLRYQNGRSANRRNCAQASSRAIKTKNYTDVNKKRKRNKKR